VKVILPAPPGVRLYAEATRLAGRPATQGGANHFDMNFETITTFLKHPVNETVRMSVTVCITSPCCRVFLLTQLVKKFQGFYETGRVITMFIRPCHWPLS
jgi:hypothetical protein